MTPKQQADVFACIAGLFNVFSAFVAICASAPEMAWLHIAVTGLVILAIKISD